MRWTRTRPPLPRLTNWPWLGTFRPDPPHILILLIFSPPDNIFEKSLRTQLFLVSGKRSEDLWNLKQWIINTLQTIKIPARLLSVRWVKRWNIYPLLNLNTKVYIYISRVCRKMWRDARWCDTRATSIDQIWHRSHPPATPLLPADIMSWLELKWYLETFTKMLMAIRTFNAEDTTLCAYVLHCQTALWFD